jgi:mono/diheme cytochrome c family protein
VKGSANKEIGMRAFGWVALMVLAGCAVAEPPGAELYVALCAGCHGVSGKGDGVIAGELPVVPADLTRLAASNGGVFPRERAMAWIHGYPDRYSAGVMPEFGPLLDGETVMVVAEDGTRVPTQKSLVLIVSYLESLQEG